MKFYFEERSACLVSFFHAIEADTIEEAEELHNQGEYDYVGHVVGDVVDYLPTETRQVSTIPEKLAQ